MSPDTAAIMQAVQCELPFSAPTHLCEVLGALGAETVAAPGTFLFQHGDPCRGVFVIKSGRVRVWVPTDRVAFERFAGPGCVLGLPATMSGKSYSLSAEVIEETQYVFVDRQTVLHSMGHNPELCMEVLNILSREVQQLREKL